MLGLSETASRKECPCAYYQFCLSSSFCRCLPRSISGPTKTASLTSDPSRQLASKMKSQFVKAPLARLRSHRAERYPANRIRTQTVLPRRCRQPQRWRIWKERRLSEHANRSEERRVGKEGRS